MRRFPSRWPARAGLLALIALAAVVSTATSRASFPGEPGRIAFMSNRTGNFDIYTAKQNGQDVVQLTTQPAADLFPTWSADGAKIAFTSLRDGNGEIYVMNADGSGQQRITHNSSYDESPVFSPDGTKIAFASNMDAPIPCPGTARTLACEPYTEIYVVNVD